MITIDWSGGRIFSAFFAVPFFVLLLWSRAVLDRALEIFQSRYRVSLSVVRYPPGTKDAPEKSRSKKRKLSLPLLGIDVLLVDRKKMLHTRQMRVPWKAFASARMLQCAGKAISARGRSGVHSSVEVGDESVTRATTRVTGTIPQGGRGIAVSQYAELQRIFTAEDILQYGRLIGDLNPIHLRGHGDDNISSDGRSGETMMPAKFKRICNKDGQPEAVVHGMLVASLFSSIFGTLITGSVYRSQRLEFRQPVFAGDTIIARVEVTNVRNMKGRGSLVMCNTSITSGGTDDGCSTTFVDGEAKVWLPGIT